MTYKAGLVHTWDGFCPLPPRVPGGPADCTGTSESQGARQPEKTHYGRAAPAACGNAASPGSHIPLGKQAGRLDGSSTTSHHTAEKRKRVKPADQPPGSAPAGSSRSFASTPRIPVLAHRVTGEKGTLDGYGLPARSGRGRPPHAKPAHSDTSVAGSPSGESTAVSENVLQ